MVIITAIYAYFTLKLAKESKLAREQSSRAYVIIELIKADNYWRLIIRNAGSIVATNVKIIANPELQELQNAFSVLGPGREFIIKHFRGDIPKLKDRACVLDVKIEYGDAWKDNRKDEFQYIISEHCKY